MKKVRVIPRLDVKGPNVVKGIQLEGLRVVGKPALLARRYYEQGADEILYIDIVASLYERNNLLDIVKESISLGVFIPMTVGGGIRTIEDIQNILRAGADKVAINTAATRNPKLITEASRIFGSQCIVGAVEAKKTAENRWEAYIDNGRERTGLDVIEWVKKLVELGAGEILITSVDRDGTQQGYDEELIKNIVSSVNVPVVACGGASSEKDVASCIKNTGCDGISLGTILHYNKATIGTVKEQLRKEGVAIRAPSPTVDIQKTARKKKAVSIIDYGAGNLMSVMTAFKAVGNDVKLINSKKEVEEAELLVLPGDGAFGFGIEQLKKLKLIEPIKEYVAKEKPFFGICLGMQLLMTESYEFGHYKGLNLIEGAVLPFKAPSQVKSEPNYKIPHMGWNELVKPSGVKWEETMLSKIKDGSEAYFVHSYQVLPKNKKVMLAKTIYGGQEFCSVLQKGNIYGTQFHPEKSGEIGMKMLEYFSNL